MRNGLLIFLMALLAACQTTPSKPAFSARQVALLTEQGFKPVGENFELDIADRLLFEVDKADLMPEMAATLDKLTRSLTSVGINGATVEGHTDSTGSAEYNQQLSERRAATVKAAMVAGGLPEAAVRPMGMGETDPIADNATEEGRAENRRVVIVVTPADAIAIRD
ncbi:OmpA family protein [Novosphingobium arvoryzae]|uniref:Cell envelope biogenesis protein OmpA n=1 Tax=Novosphingobium arvoryzae TaxID=1256514 RepID=A0A918VJN2_9SPHN|nr:OmpA family protein [Novosphingobium arvoryzae]GHA01496.1 cell envelope biogenesis protein OmpA [Novosphingobium arvoryzae]